MRSRRLDERDRVDDEVKVETAVSFCPPFPGTNYTIGIKKSHQGQQTM